MCFAAAGLQVLVNRAVDDFDERPGLTAADIQAVGLRVYDEKVGGPERVFIGGLAPQMRINGAWHGGALP